MGVTNAVDFVWSPGRNFGGSAKQIRFLAEDSKGNGTPLDVTVMVEKCVWNVAPGDTLDSIATMFGTNYVQVSGVKTHFSRFETSDHSKEKSLLGRSRSIY